MSETMDILAIGDVVTDAFIELLPHEAEIDESPKDHHPLLCMTYGTKIPFKQAIIINAVGNSANAAVSFAKLGLKTGFIANVGDDQVGQDIIRQLHHQKVSTEFVHVNKGKVSNYHYVLWYGDDRTILIKHEDYEYHLPKLHGHLMPNWLYLSSASESATPMYDELAEFLTQNPEVKLAFQPGTFQMRLGVERLKKLYAHTELFAVNKEEAQLVTGKKTDDIKELAKTLHSYGPKIVVITDGPKASYASDGQKVWHMPNYPDPKPPFERTGAGDSYTSTFVACIAKGMSIEEALLWAPINSMSVVQKLGAQAGLLDEAGIKDWLKKAPQNYKPSVMN